MDLRRIAPVKVCPPDHWPAGVLPLLDDAPDAPLIYTGALENHPRLLEAIAFEFEVIGCSADTVRRVRRPEALADLPEIRRIKIPKIVRRRSLISRLSRLAFGALSRRRYLRKPLNSCGGHGVGFFHPASPIGRDHFLQQYVRGTPFSVVYVADGWSCRILGFSEQIVGEPEFGGRDFLYCGSVAPFEVTRNVRDSLTRLGVLLTQKHDVRGVWGLDAVMDRRGRVWPIEVNPRYTASCEVVEKAYGVTALSREFHEKDAAATKRRRAARGRPFCAKAVLYARSDGQAPDFFSAFPDDTASGTIADIPTSGSLVHEGEPLCTIFAEGRSREACETNLRMRAAAIYTQLEASSSTAGASRADAAGEPNDASQALDADAARKAWPARKGKRAPEGSQEG